MVIMVKYVKIYNTLLMSLCIGENLWHFKRGKTMNSDWRNALQCLVPNLICATIHSSKPLHYMSVSTCYCNCGQI